MYRKYVSIAIISILFVTSFVGLSVQLAFAPVENNPPNKHVNPNPPNRATAIPASVALPARVTDLDEDAMKQSFDQKAAAASTPLGFIIVALPDTQYYSQDYPAIFDNQTQWAVDNVENMNIVFVSQEGDIVNTYTDLSQWNNANHSLSMLDSHVPWGVLPGYNDGVVAGDLTNYNSYFGYNRFDGESWYGGAYLNTNTNSFQLFSVGEDRYLIFHLQYNPSNRALQWAGTTIDNNPGRRVIVVTHDYLNADGTRTSIGANIWQRLIQPRAARIFLVLCAAQHAEASRTDIVNGHSVYQLLSNYQMRSNGGNGWLRMYQFHPAEDKIYVKTYSPYLNSFETDSDSEFTLNYDMTGPSYILTANVTPTGSGTVSPNNTGPYYYGDQVMLTAVPTIGWTFSSWSGDLSGSVNPSVITMDGNKTVTANFTQLQYTLTLNISPVGCGAVNLNNTGPYHYGDLVELTALPTTGHSFSYWSDDLSGSENPAVITIDSDKTVTANFVQLEYTLTVTVSPLGSGSVNLNDTSPYHFGDQVELTAVPAAGWAFSNWSGDLIGSVNPAVITVNNNKTVTASFVREVYSLTATVLPEGSGSVSFNASGPHHYGNVVELTAVPNFGWSFSFWTGNLSGSTNPEVITIDGSKVVTANFVQLDYDLTTTVDPVEGGSVNVNTTGPLHYGDWVRLTAVANSGWAFSQWSDDASGTTVQVDILIDGDKSVTASFARIEYTLTVGVSGHGVTNATGVFAHYAFTNVTVVATADYGYFFHHWILDDLDVGSANPYTINMTDNFSLTVVFAPIQYSLVVSTVGSGSVALNNTGPDYYYGDVVLLTANPDLSWSFDHWEGDLTGRTNPAVLTVTKDMFVYAAFTRTQYSLTVKSVKPWYWTGNTSVYSVVYADVDGDTSIEMVTGGSFFDGTRYVAQLCVWNGSTLALENVMTWYWTSDTWIASVAAGDVDGDGSVEIVTGGAFNDGIRDWAQLVVWDGATLAPENVKAWYWTADTSINSVAVGDVDADSFIEIVTGGHYNDGTRSNAQLVVWDGSTLALESLKVWYWTSDTYITSVITADVDGDGSVEIVTGGYYNDGVRYSAQLVVWDGSSLELKNLRTWCWTSDTVIDSVAVGDVDGDDSVEIVTGGYHLETDGEYAQLVVWSGSNLTLENVKTWHWEITTRINSVTVRDVDGDGSVEMVTGGYYDDGVISNAQLCIWSGSSLALENVTTWYWIDETVICSVAAGDVDNDGSAEIVSGGCYYDAARDVGQLVVWQPL